MMPQMDSGGTMHEQQDPMYGRYEGNQRRDQQYGWSHMENPSPQGGMFDDDFVESFAQRLSQRMAQGPSGKIQSQSKSKASPGQRLALAIVSVIMLVGMAGIALGVGAAHDFIVVGLIALGMLCFTVIAINAIYNNS